MATTGQGGVGRQGPVLVGVDGSAAAKAAVRYAAIEADRLGTSLRVLHVVPSVAVGSLQQGVDSLDTLDLPQLRRRRDRMLGETAAIARTCLRSDLVSTHMIAGERVPTLLAAAEGAQLVVLGAPWHPRIDRLITGSVVGAVAARADVPVVGVPEDWTPQHEHGRVVVGVKRPEDPESVRIVEQAFEIAAERKARLTVIHAWEFPVVYDNMIATTYEEQAWGDVKRGSLEELASAARGAHHEVAVDFQVRHGQGAHALVEASSSADLVIISRRPHGFPFGHLGAHGRAVLRESRCPVEVLPPAELPET